jgi:hypothetical protein
MTDGLRLYLDTADLISIADGNRVSDATVQRLIEAIEATRTTVVVSLWHVVDLRAAPSDAARRVIDAVGRFPLRGLVGLDADGVRVQPLDSFADVVDENPDAVHLVGTLANAFTNLATSAEPLSGSVPQRLVNLGARLLRAMTSAETEDEALRVGREMLYQHRRRITPERQEAMVQAVLQSELWSQRLLFSMLARKHGDVMRKHEVEISSGHVGKHVGILVDQRRSGQRDRAVQHGDLADRHHVEFAPYVDIFTGDKDVCIWLDEWRLKVPYERPVRAVNSNHLDTVIDELYAVKPETA